MGKHAARNRNRRRWWNFKAQWAQWGLEVESNDHVASDGRLPAHYQGQPVTVPHQGDWARRHAEAAVRNKTGFQPTAPQVGGWSIPKEDQRPEYVKCSFAKLPAVQFSTECYFKIKTLMEAYPNEEWGGYLQADENGIIVDLYIPEQVTTSTHWKVTTPVSADIKIDGAIHSHHVMKPSHSGTDDNHLVKNHPISVIVGRSGGKLEFEAIRTLNLPCGGWYKDTVPVEILLPERKEWLASVIDRIKRASEVTGQSPGPYRGHEVTPAQGTFDAAKWSGWSGKKDTDTPAVISVRTEEEYPYGGYY